VELQQKYLTEDEIIRHKGEKGLKKKRSRVSPIFSEIHSLKLLHELEVQKIELEMQNMELRLAREEAEESEHKSKERIKELKAIFSLGQMAEDFEILEDIYNEFVNIIVPPSMQFPEKVFVSLEIKGRRYVNIENFRFVKNQIYLSAPISIFGINMGELIVAYTEELPFIDFFEQQLINNLAGRISKITERIETKQALKESESSLQDAQQIAKMCSWEWDMASQKTHWSGNYFAILGFKPASIFELCKNILYPDDVHFLDLANKNLLKDKLPYSFNLQSIQHDGSIKWIQHILTSVIEDDKLVKLKGVVIDITERKQKEEEIIKMNDSLEKLNCRLLQVREEERALISREIHDQIGQALTAIKIDTFWLLEQRIKEPEIVTKIDGIIDLITSTISDVQRISSELRPAMLDDIGLAAALEWYCEEFANRTGLKMNMEFEKVQSENMNTNLSIYRVLQESLTNIIRHAGAKNVQVKLCRIENNLVLLIRDDGIGISRDKIYSLKSIGIIGMLERIRYSGGLLDITTPEEGGTQIRVNVPFE
jgi:PAS domain S-box-containing protein